MVFSNQQNVFEITTKYQQKAQQPLLKEVFEDVFIKVECLFKTS